VFGLENG